MSLINEEELRKTIKSIIKEENKVKKEDANEIVQSLIPEIDKMISERIKLHLRLISQKIIEII